MKEKTVSNSLVIKHSFLFKVQLDNNLSVEFSKKKEILPSQ
jgi:hypothetical protein